MATKIKQEEDQQNKVPLYDYRLKRFLPRFQKDFSFNSETK
jgi:hypothetical protein